MIEQQNWNTFIKKHAPQSGAFLQFHEWGTFQESLGRNIYRLKEEKMMAQCIEMKLPLGKTYLYCPRGPVGTLDLDTLQSFAKEKGALFLRFDPLASPKKGKKIKEVQPAQTLITSLSTPGDELLKQMHSKTRYNIRLAEKKGVEITIDPVSGSFDEIWEVFKQTGTRGAFNLHAKGYYEAMLNALSTEDCRVFLATATHEDDLLAANIMIDCAGTRTYLHGASSNKKRNLMAPYLLHWKLIQGAQEKGISAYDWWGIAPEGVDNHPWAGVTRFKLGFGGDRVEYPGTFDLALNTPWYFAYTLAKRLTK